MLCPRDGRSEIERKKKKELKKDKVGREGRKKEKERGKERRREGREKKRRGVGRNAVPMREIAGMACLFREPRGPSHRVEEE